MLLIKFLYKYIYILHIPVSDCLIIHLGDWTINKRMGGVDQSQKESLEKCACSGNFNQSQLGAWL